MDDPRTDPRTNPSWKDLLARWIRYDFQQGRRDSRHLSQLCQHPFFPIELVVEHPALEWDWPALQQGHPEFDDTFIQQIPSLYRGRRSRRSRTYSISGSLLRPVIDFSPYPPFDFVSWERSGAMSHRKFVRLSYDASLPLPLVIDYWYRPWDYAFLFQFREWQISWVRRLQRHRRIHWKVLSRNVLLTPGIVVAFLDAAWDWSALAKNPACAPHVILSIPELRARWKWGIVFLNPRITPSVWIQLKRRRVWIDHEDPSLSTLWHASPHDVFHKPYILLNHFTFSPWMRLYAAVRIHRFVLHALQRRRLLWKCHWFYRVTQQLPDPLVIWCMSYIGPL